MESNLKILHLEDDPNDAGLIQRELKKADFKFNIKVVENQRQYVEALENFKPDVILSDHSLPQFNSLEALKIYKEYKYEIPFILITGTVSEEFAITSIKEGADDYILKNNLTRLPSAIDQALKSRKVESEKRKANAELEIINKELNTFIYKAAHDLRGPLCSIMGLINVASQKDEQNNLASYILKISESTHKLDSVLLSLMEVMSIKNVTPVISEINFKALINGIVERVLFLEPNINVDFQVNTENVNGFFSDETILTTTLFNVIENAAKFRDKRKLNPYVNVRLTQLESELRIDVEDNGIGMEKSVQDNIFDMYYRGTQYSAGSGLGLYIAKSGVKKLGGAINVKSDLSIGSTFNIVLPANTLLFS